MVLKIRSVRNIVTPAANTGRGRRRTAVMRTDHTNKGVWYCVMVGGFILIIVVMTLTAPETETHLLSVVRK